MKLYKYVMELHQDKTITAEIKEYELVAETQEQYVYKNNERYFTFDKLDFITKKPCAAAAYYSEGLPSVGILPCYHAAIYTTEKTEAVKEQLIDLLKKEIEKRSFIDAGLLDVKDIEFKEEEQAK